MEAELKKMSPALMAPERQPDGILSSGKVLMMMEKAFEQGMTAKTRLILVSHPTYLDGLFFPIKRICEIAHQRGMVAALATKINSLDGFIDPTLSFIHMLVINIQ